MQETILTPANVNAASFGQLFASPVDGQVYAQPLYLQSLTIAGKTHNVVFVVTENDSVFAFDADAGGSPLWNVTLTDAAHGAAAGATAVPTMSDCSLGGPTYGITGTPVIDITTNTMYVVSMTQENGYPVSRLHALDVTSGAEKFGGPTTITATVSGSGSGSSGGTLAFDPEWENQRPGLLLVNGTVYIGWGSFCDLGPWHGWIMGYSASTLQQLAVFVGSPNGSGAGIWLSGAGLSADTDGTSGAGRMFVATGNGDFTATVPYTTGNVDYGDSIVNLNLSSGFQVADDFTPYNQATLDADNSDLGAGGVLVLPDQPGPYPHLLINLGKGQAGYNTLSGGVIFVLNRDNLGGYGTTGDNVLQRLSVSEGELGMSAYWNGNVYFWPGGGVPLWQYSLMNGVLSSSPVAVSSETSPAVAQHMANPVISANGSTNGIVWTIDTSSTALGGPTYPSYLGAHSAANVATTLYSSATNAARDTVPGSAVSFASPTVANGKVYVGSAYYISAYGLLTGPNFSLTANPASVSVAPGATATSTITVVPANGFTGTVTFSASGLPSGVTASFSPTSSSGTTTLTLSAASTAAIGSSVVTVIGTSGSLTESVAVNLTVSAAPNFSLTAAPTNLTVAQSASGTVTVSVVPSSGFTGTVAFSASGLPSGVTASFNPTSSTSATTLTLSASGSATTGTSIVTITGTSGSLTHTTAVSLTVTAAPSFALTASPGSLSIAPGGTGSSTVTVIPANGFTGSVTFAVIGLPTGVTALFVPYSASSSTVLTLSVASTAPAVSTVLTITGTSGSLTETTTLNFSVTVQPDYSLSASPASLTIAPGASGTSTVTVVPVNGFAGAVSFSASGLPSGVTASFKPTSSTSATTLTIAAASTAASGTATITITGTSGSLTHTTTLALTVTTAPYFTLTASPASLSIAPGASGSSAITIVPANGFSGSVTFAVIGLPSGVTALFVPYSATSSTVLTLSVASAAAFGNTLLTINGTSGSLTETTTLNLSVTGQSNYSLTASPATLSVAQGASGASTFAVAPVNGFTGTVAFSATGLPSGVTASFSPTSSTTSTVLTLSVASTAATGSSVVTITGTSGSLTHTTTVTLTVTAAPSFALTASPASLSIAQGASGSSTITIVPANGFSGSVTFAVIGLPTGVTALFVPYSATSSTVLTLSVASTAVIGTTVLAVNGTSGSLSETTTLNLSVTGQSNYSLTASPATLSVTQGASGTSTVTVVPVNGFTGTVGFSASGLPSGVTASFSPTSSTSSATLTLTASTTATAGTATVTITGVSGSLTQSTSLTLTVNAPTPITPYIQVNGGSWQEIASVTVSDGSTVNLGPQPLTGSWSWTGPNGYTSTSRQINDIPLSVGVDTYVATYTNSAGAKSTKIFTITVTTKRGGGA